MTTRETTFLCSWIAEGAERRVYVRAWTPREAAAALHAELREAELAVPDEVTIEEVGRSSPARSRESLEASL